MMLSRWAHVIGPLTLALSLAACGGGSDPVDAGMDGGAGAVDGGPVVDGGSGGLDAGPGTDGGSGTVDAPASSDGGGGSTVGQLCANDDNCTGTGEVCCVEELPTACQLIADCPGSTGGIPCDRRDDCPTSRVCCRVEPDQFCTPRRACEDLGGSEIP